MLIHLVPLFLCKQVIMLFLSYTGFIRLVTEDDQYEFAIVFGHIFEMFSQTLPLVMLQQFNNSFMGKWDAGLDTLNIFTSVLNFCGLVAEVTLVQLMSEGNTYYLVNKENLGFTLVA